MKKTRIYLLLTIALALVVFQCSDSPKGATDGIEEQEPVDSTIIAAMNNYQLHCSSCHGQQMEAFADRKWKHGKEIDSIKNSITNGYVDAGMPAWGAMFSEEDIDNLTKYIRKGIENVERYGFKEETLTSDTFATEEVTVHLDTIISDLESAWDINWLPNKDMLVADKMGKLLRVDGEGNQVEISGVPEVRAKGQGGLFSILLHPDFSTNNYLYLSYAKPKVEGEDTLSTTAVSRFVYQNDQLTDGKLIFEAAPYTNRRHHFGARMLFDKDGYLFVTVGDRGERDVNPQDMTRPGGKIHRMNDDGSIPEDNPFVNTPDAVKSIYSYGHRNPQGLAINPETGGIWEHEHGPRGGDELNLIEPSKNYGWPVISYGINYDGTIFTSDLEKKGMEQPLLYWVPSIAPCGMSFITSDKYKGWKGNLMVGSLRFKYLNRCVIEGNKVVKEENILKGIGRVRQVAQGPDGYIYVAVERPGAVYRLVPIN